MRSVGWIIWNPKTETKGRTGGYYSSRTTKVYRSEAVAALYCGDDEVPKEVFIQTDDE